MWAQWFRRGAGAALAFVGYMLSPLSWWNDLYVNLPLAGLSANLVSRFNSSLFFPALVISYWTTNVVGFILMHVGVVIAAKKRAPNWERKAIVHVLAVSILYTLLVGILYYIGILKPLSHYSPPHS